MNSVSVTDCQAETALTLSKTIFIWSMCATVQFTSVTMTKKSAKLSEKPKCTLKFSFNYTLFCQSEHNPGFLKHMFIKYTETQRRESLTRICIIFLCT